MEFIEFLSESALAELKIANSELVKMVSNVENVSKKMQSISTPSGSDNALKEITTQYQEQERAIKSLQSQIQKLTEVKTRSNAKTSEEIVNGRILRQNADRQAIANSNLAGAYRRLSAEVAMASEKVQNIISRGKTAEQTQRQYNKELKIAQNEFRVLQNRVLEADKAVDKWNRTGERSIGFMKNLLGAFGIVGGVTLFASISRDIFQTTKELQSLDNALKLVTETQTNYIQEQEFLSRIANQYGIELKGLTKQFTQFYVSAKDKISGSQIRDIFESITKAAASLGLSTEQQERAFLALNQMMSKGTIQAEELRGQLGEALPGAFGIMAKAIGITEKELQKMMKAGDVIASEVLPKFAKQLEITYGIENINNIRTLTSEQNRLSNAWTDFVRSLDEDGNKLTKILMSVLGLMTDTITGWRDILTTAETRRKNTLQQIRIDAKNAVEEYYATNSDFDKKDLANKKANYEEEARMIRNRLENLLNVNKQIKKTAVLSPFRQMTKEDNKRIRDNQKEINLLNEKLSLYYGNIEGLISVLTRKNAVTKINTELTEEQIKAKERLIKKLREEYLERTKIEDLQPKEIEKGFLYSLREQKKIFEQLRDEVSSTAEEYKNYQKVIDGLDQAINLIVDPSKAITQTGVDEFLRLYSNNAKQAKDNSKELEDALKSLFQTTANGALSSFGMDSLIPMFDGTFNKMWETANTFNEKFAVGMKYIGDVAKETFEFINQQQQAQYDAQYQRLEQEKDVALLFAGESATAREEIERQYEERRKQIQRRQAEAQKKMAIFNSIINTAQGVTSALAMTPPNIPLSIAIGVIGAVQTAMIASQQIPQFYKGTDNAPEGWAYTQEKGAEIITDKNGKIKTLGSNKGAELTYLNKGDKVYTAQQTSLMFDNNLNEILTNNGILMPKVNINVDNQLTNAKLDAIADAIKTKETIQFNYDKKGFELFKKEQGSKIKMNNLRLRTKGYDI